VPTQVFRYEPVQGRLAPIITMGIKLSEVWYPIGVYVDSGAAYTLLHATVAQGAGFDYRTGYLVYLTEVLSPYIGMILNSTLGQSGSWRGSGFQRDWEWRSPCSGGKVSLLVSRFVFRSLSVF
jgi:hypothetical protein